MQLNRSDTAEELPTTLNTADEFPKRLDEVEELPKKSDVNGYDRADEPWRKLKGGAMFPNKSNIPARAR